jgi:hypothetical protein
VTILQRRNTSAFCEKEEKEAEEYERKLLQQQQSDDGHNQHAEKPFRGVDESPDAKTN